MGVNRWDLIPKKTKEDIINVVDYVRSALPNPPTQHMEWLFEVYHTYVNPNACKKLTCRTDRAHVLNVLNTYVTVWKKQEESSQKQ